MVNVDTLNGDSVSTVANVTLWSQGAACRQIGLLSNDPIISQFLFYCHVFKSGQWSGRCVTHLSVCIISCIGYAAVILSSDLPELMCPPGLTQVVSSFPFEKCGRVPPVVRAVPCMMHSALSVVYVFFPLLFRVFVLGHWVSTYVPL